MLAREHLSDEPEREELDADDHEQDAEQQKGSLADPRTAYLHGREVQQDPEAGGAERQPDPAEKVQGSIAVATHEGHREQIEEAADVALGPEPRLAVQARPVIYWNLRDA